MYKRQGMERSGMIKVCELSKNSVVEINGDPHVVEQLRTQSPLSLIHI